MKKTVFFLIFMLFLFNGTAICQDHVAMIKKTTGTVQVIRGQKSIDAFKGMQLMSQDVLEVSSNGYSGIIFTDGTMMTFGPDTKIEIDKYMFEPEKHNYDFSMYMHKGSAIYTSGKLGKLAPESIKLKTPKAILGVRGTRFIVNVK